MRRKGLLSLAVVVLAIAGCGGDDGDDTGAQEEAARAAVADTIAAFQEADYATVCDLLDQRGLDSITSVAKTDTCPEAYEVLFKNQSKFAGTPGKPFDDYVETLGDYEVGEATLEETDGSVTVEVALEGPIEGVISFVVEEDGQMKVSELFVTPDANTNPGSSLKG